MNDEGGISASIGRCQHLLIKYARVGRSQLLTFDLYLYTQPQLHGLYQRISSQKISKSFVDVENSHYSSYLNDCTHIIYQTQSGT